MEISRDYAQVTFTWKYSATITSEISCDFHWKTSCDYHSQVTFTRKSPMTITSEIACDFHLRISCDYQLSLENLLSLPQVTSSVSITSEVQFLRSEGCILTFCVKSRGKRSFWEASFSVFESLVETARFGSVDSLFKGKSR